MHKKIITYFLLLVMAIQILPIEQLGRMLFTNQFTEEFPHIVATEKDGHFYGDHKRFFLDTSSISTDIFFTDLYFQYVHFADAIPPNHVVDIIAPPPNC